MSPSYNTWPFLPKVILKGEFAVVPTDKICGWNLSSNITVDMNIILMKLYVIRPTRPNGPIPQKFEFSK